MNTSRIAPVSAKLKRGSQHSLNGNPVYIERDRGDGTLLISDSPLLRPEDNYWSINKSDLKLSYKKGSSISSKPKPPTEKQKSDQKDMNSFFDSLAGKVPFNCQSCRKALYAFNKIAKRACTAHLFPKAHFKSIATDADNIVFLGCDFVGSACDCHTKYDYSLDKRKKMPIYDIAVKRFYEKLRVKMTPKEIVMAEDYLGLSMPIKEEKA